MLQISSIYTIQSIHKQPLKFKRDKLQFTRTTSFITTLSLGTISYTRCTTNLDKIFSYLKKLERLDLYCSYKKYSNLNLPGQRPSSQLSVLVLSPIQGIPPQISVGLSQDLVY